MDERIFRVLKGRGTETDEEWLVSWRDASPENEERFQYLSDVLARYQEVEEARPVPDSRPARYATLRAVRRTPAQAQQRGGTPSLRRLVLAGMAAAAIVLLGLGLTTLYWSQPEWGAQSFVTGSGERATVELADGTVVRLGPDSHLTLPGRGLQREVSLTGRAYFAVAKHGERRFVVQTSGGRVTVLGTRFDVQTEAEGLQVAVVEGRVAVSSDGVEEAELAAGQVYRRADGRDRGQISSEGPLSDLDWTGKFLAFQSTPLSDVAVEIGQKYGVEVQIHGDALSERVVTAWFADHPLSVVLDVVCLAVAAQCSIEGDSVIISPANSDEPHPSDLSSLAPNRS